MVLTGCAVGPNYRAPCSDVTNEWHAEAAGEPLIVDWWNQFDDPLLSKYVAMAAQYNNTLKAAEANIMQARGMREMAASPLFPHLSADFNAGRIHFSKNGLLLQIPRTKNIFTLLFDASWEIDLFGKTTRAVQAATARVGASIEKKNDVLITLTAELVRNYVELRIFQKQMELIEENIDLLEKKQTIVAKQLEVGYVNQTAYDSVIVDLSLMRASLPLLKAQITQDVYMISILTGSLPEALTDELSQVAPPPKIPDKIAVGLRSDLLRRRPDIREKERELAAATADIGVAVASFFPSVSLFAIPGFQSTKIKNFFSADSGTWLLDGNVNMPIFQGGNLIGNLKVKRAAAAAAAYQYQETVLRALQEAESSLSAYDESLLTLADIAERNRSNQHIADITQKQYDAGYASLLTFINAERQLNDSQQLLLDSQLFSLLKLVSLYKALGGGWEVIDCH